VSYDWPKIGILLSVFLFIDGAAAWLVGIEISDPARHLTLSPYAPYGLFGGPLLLIAACAVAFAAYHLLARREPELPRLAMPVPPTQPERAPEKPAMDGQREERIPEPKEGKK